MLSLFQIPQAVGSQDPGALEEIRPGYGHGQGLDDSRHSGTVRGGTVPWRMADGVLASEQHLTVCHYLRCKSCGNLYYVGGLHPGETGFPASDRPRHRTHRFPFVGGAAGRFSRISESSNHQAAVRQNRAAAFFAPSSTNPGPACFARCARPSLWLGLRETLGCAAPVFSCGKAPGFSGL